MTRPAWALRLLELPPARESGWIPSPTPAVERHTQTEIRARPLAS